MHELSLCQSIIKSVSQSVDAGQIKMIYLKIGQLALVDIASLKFWFPVAAKGTLCEGAVLEIQTEEAQAQCCECGASYAMEQYYTICPSCGSSDRNILAGEGLQLVSVEIS